MTISSTISFSIIVDSKAPITINAQIAEQIKILIAIGELEPGDGLPTVTQLAKYLGVNHNTIATVYNDLIESGYLIAQRGKGTFVANTPAVQKILTYTHFYNLLGQAFSVATLAGLSPSEFSGAAYGQAVRFSRYKSGSLKLVFVECLQNNFNIYEAVKLEIGQPLLLLNWEDLQAQQPQALRNLLDADIVVTTLQYLREITQMTTSEQEVIAVDIKPETPLLTHISSRPHKTNVLLVSQGEFASQLMKEILENTGISHVFLQAVSLEYLQNNLQILENFDLVISSVIVENNVNQYIDKASKRTTFNAIPESLNISVLKARIAAIQLAKSKSPSAS